jgi:hypothetical protein
LATNWLVWVGPILLQKSAGSVHSNFLRPWECPSKKRVGDHPNYSSLNERLPQPRYDSFEQHFLIATRFAPIFMTRRFPTFATKSAKSRHQLRINARRPVRVSAIPQDVVM